MSSRRISGSTLSTPNAKLLNTKATEKAFETLMNAAGRESTKAHKAELACRKVVGKRSTPGSTHLKKTLVPASSARSRLSPPLPTPAASPPIPIGPSDWTIRTRIAHPSLAMSASSRRRAGRSSAPPEPPSSLLGVSFFHLSWRWLAIW